MRQYVIAQAVCNIGRSINILCRNSFSILVHLWFVLSFDYGFRNHASDYTDEREDVTLAFDDKILAMKIWCFCSCNCEKSNLSNRSNSFLLSFRFTDICFRFDSRYRRVKIVIQ